MKFSVSDKVSKFSFEVGSKDLEAAIKKINSVLSASNAASGMRNHFLVAQKGKLYVLAYSSDTYIYVNVEAAKATEDGIFGFNPELLGGIIKGRAYMHFEFTGTDCKFKAAKGKYEGSIVTLPVATDSISLINENFGNTKKGKNDSVLPRDVLNVLKEGVSLTSVKDVYTGTPLLSYIHLSTNGTLNVSSFDQHHFGYYKTKVGIKDLSFKVAILSSHFQLIDSLVDGEEARFSITSESLRVKGHNFELILPSTQTDEKNFTLIPDFIKELPDPIFDCEYGREELQTVVGNLFTLHSVNAAFELSYKTKAKDRLKIAFTTSAGSASDALKIKATKAKDIVVKVEPKVMNDTISLLKQGIKDTTLSIIKDKALMLKGSTKSGDLVLVNTLV